MLHPLQTPDPLHLIQALTDRDESALEQAYDVYGGVVFALALRMLRKRPEAEEVVQDVFLQLWNRAATFDPSRSSLPGFLMMITRSRCIDRLRAARSRPAPQGDTVLLAVPCDRRSPLDSTSLSEAGERVSGAMESLPDGERDVLLMAFFEGLTHTQIATRTGTPLGTVKTRARNGLRRLRESLGEMS